LNNVLSFLCLLVTFLISGMLPARADAEIYLRSRTTVFSYQQVTIQQAGLHLEFSHFEKRVITAQYRYDPLTRRISRSTGAIPSTANTYQFAFSGSSPVHEWDGDISSTGYHQQRTGSGVGGLLQTQEADGTTTHPRHNLRGDITAQFNASGTLLWHGSYASNGMLNHQYGTRDGNYGANGKYEEPAGLLNEGFRYRDRLTNTFITRDPAGFIDGPNDYNYVRHNPWSAWDPNGLSSAIINIPEHSGHIGYTGDLSGAIRHLQSLQNSVIAHLSGLGSQLQPNSSLSNQQIESAYQQFTADYRYYLQALQSVQTQFSGDLFAYNPFSRSGNSKEINSDLDSLRRLTIVPTDTELAALLPRSLLKTALASERITYSSISALYDSDIQVAAEVTNNLETELAIVNAASLLTGAGGITSRAISLGASRATVIYLTETGITMGAATAIVSIGNESINQAVESGSMTENQATITRLGIQAASLYLTARAVKTPVPKSAAAANTPAMLGRQGENAIRQATGLANNTQSFVVNGRTRIPDFVTGRSPSGAPTGLIESKNVQYQSLTRQLRDYADLVRPAGGRVDVALPPGSRVSRPLQRAFDDADNPLFRMDLPQ